MKNVIKTEFLTIHGTVNMRKSRGAMADARSEGLIMLWQATRSAVVGIFARAGLRAL